MELQVSEYRDPGQVVSDVVDQSGLVDGDVLLALVRAPSTLQQVVTVSRLETDQWRHLDGYDRAQLLAAEARKLPVPDARPGAPPCHSIMTIVARRGWCLIGPAEAEWLIAWRYSNHFVSAFSGDLIVVTEHGWTDFMTGWGGYQPRLAG